MVERRAAVLDGGRLCWPHCVHLEAFRCLLCANADGAVVYRSCRLRDCDHSMDLQALTRSAKDVAADEAASFQNRTARSAVRHVVLAVHGIGQRMGGRTVADDAQDVRVRVNSMLDEFMPGEVGQGFVQVLPVQWRKNLDLEVRKYLLAPVYTLAGVSLSAATPPLASVINEGVHMYGARVAPARCSDSK